MNKIIAALLAIGFVGTASAQTVFVINEELGSDKPNANLPGIDNSLIGTADVWDARDHLYHLPQYLPGYPTAATIWPRVLPVKCVKGPDDLICHGYHWTPDMGRGEYLFIHPQLVDETPSPAPEPKIVEKIIIKEVPVKKNNE